MPYPSISEDCGSLSQLEPSVAQTDVHDIVERSLREVLLICEQACATRQSAPEGSPDWYKRTGEILACAKLTSVLCKLEQGIRAQDRAQVHQ
jgi:hypothetical protein